MIVTRKLAAILVADIVGFSRLAGADEDRVLARLRAMRSDLIDPTISVHNGRVVKRTGDGVLVEFRSVVDAVRCAIEMQNGLIERNAGLPEDRRIQFRIGVHLGDVVEEADGDLMGDGVNIAARLEGIAKPGAIALSEDAYRQVRGRLDFAVSDMGLQALKNIAEPLRVYSLEVGTPADSRPAPLESPPQKAGPPRCSIVVLPFASLGGGEEQELFVDGVTESLTTDLSRLANTVVVARNTAFTYKGKSIDAKQIGRELNVRYILEGSIQRGAGRMRINTQFIDAATGNHIWADRFDKPIADLFDMQDEIVSRLANQLRAELIAAEAERAEHEPNPDALDFYFRGVAAFNKGRLENILRAKDLFEQALKLDPAHVDAIVGAARADVLTALYLQERHADRLKSAETELLNALAIDPRNHWAHLWLGYVQVLTNRAARGDRRVRARAVAQPQHRRRACLDRPRQDHARPRRGDRGACRGGVPHFADRRGHVPLEVHRRAGEALSSAPTPRRSSFSANRSTEAGTSRSTISTMRRRSLCSAARAKRRRRSRRGSPSRRISISLVSGPRRKATIRCFSPSASG